MKIHIYHDVLNETLNHIRFLLMVLLKWGSSMDGNFYDFFQILIILAGTKCGMNRILPIPAVLDVAVFRGSHFLNHFIFGWMKGAQV